MYAISTDGPARLIEVKLSGLLSLDELNELRAAMHATLRRHGFRPGTFLLLMDSTENPIQPREVHESLSSFGFDADIMPARIAIWTGNSPSRMQARRAEAECPMRLFRQRDEALTWLTATTWRDAAAAARDFDDARRVGWAA